MAHICKSELKKIIQREPGLHCEIQVSLDNNVRQKQSQVSLGNNVRQKQSQTRKEEKRHIYKKKE